MIKSIFLNHKSKAFAEQRDHCTYNEAEHIGILYNAEEYDEEILAELSDSIQGDGKSVALLGFVEKPTEEQLLFSKKDISGTGTIKKDAIAFFTKQSFDFLISLDTSDNINFRYILAISKATCKIGLETESYGNLLQMSLKPEADNRTSAMNVMRYLKMI